MPDPRDPRLDPAGDATNRSPEDESAGGADSSPAENAPSGEKAAAVEKERHRPGAGPGDTTPSRS